MIKRRVPFDVFISHAATDQQLAARVRSAFDRAGIAAFDNREAASSENLEAATYDAMAESRAVVLILTPSSVRSPNVIFEAGAAAAWDKPVFVINEGVENESLPGNLRLFPQFRISEISKIVSRLQPPLSDVEIDQLKSVYQRMQVPVDEIAVESSKLDELTRAYADRTERGKSSEILLQELLRLRKQGRLPRLRRA